MTRAPPRPPGLSPPTLARAPARQLTYATLVGTAPHLDRFTADIAFWADSRCQSETAHSCQGIWIDIIVAPECLFTVSPSHLIPALHALVAQLFLHVGVPAPGRRLVPGVSYLHRPGVWGGRFGEPRHG